MNIKQSVTGKTKGSNLNQHPIILLHVSFEYPPLVSHFDGYFVLFASFRFFSKLQKGLLPGNTISILFLFPNVLYSYDPFS